MASPPSSAWLPSRPPQSPSVHSVSSLSSHQSPETAALPLSPPKTALSPHYARSPNSSRRVKRDTAFPREELWTWHSNGAADTTSSIPTRYPPDAIESVLRESALSSLQATPVTSSPPVGSVGHTGDRVRPPLLLAHHQHPHGVATPLTPATTTGSPVSSPLGTPSGTGTHALPSPPSQQQQQQQQQHSPSFGVSKRKLGKNNTHAQLRISSRNLTSPPSSSSSSSRDIDGWKAFKMAQRTKGLIAKTRKVLEVLHRNGDSTHKIKQPGQGESDQEDTEVANVAASGVVETEMESDERSLTEERERGTKADRLTAQQQFERDVWEEGDGDDLVADEVAAPTSPVKFMELRQSTTTHLDGNGSPSSNSNSHMTGIVGGSDEFWKIYQSASTGTRPDSARSKYIANCEAQSLLVLPVLDLKRPSRYNATTKTLRFDNYYFGDERAEAFGGSLHLLPVPVNHLSMKNVGLTSPGSSAIVHGLPLRQLQHLNFSENHIGAKGAMTIFKGLGDPHVNLKTLDLGNNRLGDQVVSMLMQCLVNRCTLEHLDLRKNNIYHAAKAVGELLRITTPLRSLNLSWNNIRGEPAQYLAKCMMENITLTSLDLADNTLGNNGNADAELGACLATNKSLKSLDVSNNHIHGKSVLVYVNGLQQNATLESLILRGNPIGNLGTEAIVRSVASGAISKCEVDMGECNVEIQETNQQTVIYGGGAYTLNLCERADAILLKELLLLNWKSKNEIWDPLWNGSPYTFNRKDERSFTNTIPSSGVMQLKAQPNYDRREELVTTSGLARIERLLQRSFGSGRDGDEAAKLFCIRLLAEEYSFTIDHANILIALFQTHTSQVEKASAAALLIPQITGTKGSGSASTSAKGASTSSSSPQEIYDWASMDPPSEFFEDKDKDGKIDVCGDICMVIGLKNLSDVEQAHVEKRVGKWISFNSANPTGHYRLNMGNPIDRRILTRLLETNRLEKKLRQQYKLMDTSQHGLATQPLQGGFRNTRLNHVTVQMCASWQFPRRGIFEFDFVQTKRPFSICTALSDAAFEQFLREFKSLDVNAETKLIGLRSISSSYYFNSSQAQRLMEHFGTFERDHETGVLFRAEVFIILFSRLVDEWNFGETLALLDLATKQQVVDRLGPLHCFHPLQVAESYGALQFTMYDHRQLVLILVKLALSGEAELLNVAMNNETVVPQEEWKLWTSDDKMPSQGVLSCSMRASHGLQNESQLAPNSVRKKLIQTVLLKLENRTQEIVS